MNGHTNGKMVNYINNPINAMRLMDLLLLEANRNLEEVERRSEWKREAIGACCSAILNEQTRIREAQFESDKNSVKGESAIKKCYGANGGRAPDVISLRGNNRLQLIELKYAQKVGNTRMLSSTNFTEKISDKFLETTALMEDEEVIPLRIIVVVEEQLPTFVYRLREIVLGQDRSTRSDYSTDGQRYKSIIFFKYF